MPSPGARPDSRPIVQAAARDAVRAHAGERREAGGGVAGLHQRAGLRLVHRADIEVEVVLRRFFLLVLLGHADAAHPAAKAESLPSRSRALSPPRAPKRTKPSLSMWVATRPTESMWAASISFGPSPLLWAIRLPITSCRSASQYGSASEAIRSRTSPSSPETPVGRGETAQQRDCVR